MPARRKKTGRGRKPIEFDLKQVEAMGACKAAHEEMAAFFGCHAKTIARNMTDPDSPFCAAYKTGLGKMKIGLRRAQLSFAMKGNTALLIFLGKNYLAQSDTPPVEQDPAQYARSLERALGTLDRAFEEDFEAKTAPLDDTAA